MSAEQHATERRVERSGSGSPGWWLVFRRELTELWLGGRALTLLSLFSILLGITAFLIATNAELELIPPKEVASLMLQPSIAFGLFIGLIIGADSISGERERSTLEALLLTPTSRRQIIVGKFLAAASPWPAALAISFPFVAVLSQWDEVLGQALLWGTLLGTMLALAFTGVGMLVSFWSNSNRTSLFVSLLIYFVFFLPTQFPGEAQKGLVGQLIKRANPMEATKHFIDKILVNNRTVDEMGVLLTLSLNPEDMGKVIGRAGNTAKAIRMLLRVIGLKGNARVNLKILEPEGAAPRPRASHSVDEAMEDIKKDMK